MFISGYWRLKLLDFFPIFIRYFTIWPITDSDTDILPPYLIADIIKSLPWLNLNTVLLYIPSYYTYPHLYIHT